MFSLLTCQKEKRRYFVLRDTKEIRYYAEIQDPSQTDWRSIRGAGKPLGVINLYARL
jgi:hypothetical protein